VKTYSVKAGLTKTVAAMSLLSPEPIAVRSALPIDASQNDARFDSDDRLPPPPPGSRPGVLGVLSAKDIGQPPVQRTVTASVTPMAPAATAPAVARESGRSAASATPAEGKPRVSGWVIQVGAFEDRDEAHEKLAAAQSKAGNLLRGAAPYTELFKKGERRFFRARFAGLKENVAEQACKELQKNKMACFATRN
jgi:D-alanyl-D-alanine carboxypeptidase